MDRIKQLLKSTYVNKGTDFSASQLTKPKYQLWVEFNSPKDAVHSDEVGFKSFLGSAMHKAFEHQNLSGVVQEFTYKKTLGAFSIGGTADRIDFLKETGMWQLGDYKLKGAYSYKKFIEGDDTNEVMQLSIYRWLFDGLFEIQDEATIFLFMAGHKSFEKYPEMQEVAIELLPIEDVEAYLIDKIAAATGSSIPELDCNLKWQCSYCDCAAYCPYQKSLESDGFTDES
ncbi:MAG: PD-(D/E)XK nuclease family protein [Ignisphaera sp.]|nr:PD-(D/E)XK nuclease family protein [Ignisphaera sp.]